MECHPSLLSIFVCHFLSHKFVLCLFKWFFFSSFLNPVFWFWNSKFFAKVFFVRKSLFCFCPCNYGFWNWNWGSLQQQIFSDPTLWTALENSYWTALENSYWRTVKAHCSKNLFFCWPITLNCIGEFLLKEYHFSWTAPIWVIYSKVLLIPLQ